MKKLFLALSALILTACTDYTPKTLADGTTAKF